MGIEIKVESKDIQKVENALRVALERGNNLRPVMGKLGASMVGIVDRNFAAEGRPTKWKPRSPITQGSIMIGAQKAAAKTKRYQNAKSKGRASILRRVSLSAAGNKILSRSGELKNSITYRAGENKVLVGPGTGIPYARIHQLGGVIRPKNGKALLVPCGNRILRLKQVKIPARPYLTVPSGEVPFLARVAVGELERMLIPNE